MQQDDDRTLNPEAAGDEKTDATDCRPEGGGTTGVGAEDSVKNTGGRPDPDAPGYGSTDPGEDVEPVETDLRKRAEKRLGREQGESSE